LPLPLFVFFVIRENSLRISTWYVTCHHWSRYVISHPDQLSLAIRSWVDTMSTSCRAVMPCSWGAKTGMVYVWVAGKTVWSHCYTLLTGQLSLPSLRGRQWIPTSAGKVKAGMVHSVSGWTRDVQVELWDPLKTRVIPQRIEVCSRQGAIQIHVYLYLGLPYLTLHMAISAWALTRCSLLHDKALYKFTLCYFALLERCSATAAQKT